MNVKTKIIILLFSSLILTFSLKVNIAAKKTINYKNKNIKYYRIVSFQNYDERPTFSSYRSYTVSRDKEDYKDLILFFRTDRLYISNKEDIQTNSIGLSKRNLSNWIEISTKSVHTCGIYHNRTLWCWGNNSAGQLGDGTEENKSFPVQVGRDKDWKQVSTGGLHTCAIKLNGTLWCWGRNWEGQLGIEGYIDSNVPIQIGSEGDWVQVSCGRYHTCGIKSDKSLWCWGYNEYGQIGDGTTENRYTLIKVGNSNEWVSISAGANHTCAIKTDNSLWCWGDNESGQVNGSQGNSIIKELTLVNLDNDWKSVSAGGRHTCAIKFDGTLWCWGNNDFGQIGLEAFKSFSYPNQITFENNWAEVSCGEIHTCTTKSNGTLFCFGDNNFGQIGLGYKSKNPIKEPSVVDSSSSWLKIVCGEDNSCGIKSDSSLWCWGFNRYGQIGDGTTKSKYYPTLIGVKNLRITFNKFLKDIFF